METDDLAAYYTAFGQTATLTHGATTTSISVIFDRAGAMVQAGELEVQTAAPVARCKSSDVTSAVRGDSLVVSSTTYKITNVEPLNNEESLIHLTLES